MATNADHQKAHRQRQAKRLAELEVALDQREAKVAQLTEELELARNCRNCGAALACPRCYRENTWE
jgi:hypothetical protein